MMYPETMRVKREIIDLGAQNYEFIKEAGHTVWGFAELARDEYHSCYYLTKRLESIGFTVQRGIGGFPTGFVANFDNGSGPVIGLLCEYDALPGLSSTVPGEPGHGCGHSLFAAGALGSALLLKTIMEKEKLGGCIRVFGTPSEENLGAKQHYVRQGIFNGTDVVFSMHPHIYNGVFFNAHNAINTKFYRFYGLPAHAGSMPEKGRSALDALELMNVGVQFLREHVTPDVRIHYSITNGGQAANIVPAFAESNYAIRAQQIDALADVVRRVDLIANGAAMMTETRVESEFRHQYANMILNNVFAELAQKNVEIVGSVEYDEQDQKNARELGFQNGITNEITPLPVMPGIHGGSSDEGDVSWVVPMTRICYRTCPSETPNHSVIREKQADFPASYKAMTQTAKAVACTAFDLLTQPEKLAEIKATHAETLRGRIYPSDGMIYPEVKTFPDAYGVSKIDNKTLSVKLADTIILQDMSNINVFVYRGEELLGKVFAKDKDVVYNISMSAPVKKGDQLILRYQCVGENEQALLGYFHKKLHD